MAAIPAGLALLFWMGVRGEQLMNAREYVELYAWFRNPHHLIPTVFLSRDWSAFAYFLVAGGISWAWWYRRPETSRPIAIRIAIVVGLLLTLMLCGWLFVQVWPTRLWATLQAYRFVFALKWLGLLLFAGTIARLATGSEPGQPAVAAMMFFPVGLGQPLVVLAAHITETIRRRLKPLAGTSLWLFISFSMLLSVGIVVLMGFRSQEFFALALVGLMAVCWFAFRRRWFRHLAALGLVGLAIGLIFLNKYYPIGTLSGLLRGTRPILVFSDVEDPITDYCRDYTPDDAVFLTPPRYERFKLAAQRTPVVEFKCLSDASDSGLIDWRQRLTDCYGEVEGYGWEAVDEMQANYRHISDAQMLLVARKYGADFALLYANTPTGFPVLAENFRYKVVAIEPESAAPTVSLVVFRAGPSSVEHADAYFNWLLQQQMPGAVLREAYISPVDEPIGIEEAVEMYRQSLNDELLSDLGQRYRPWQGNGPDGYPATVLFFMNEGGFGSDEY